MTAAILTAPSVAIPPPAPNSPDADLIRLCSEYVALSLERDRILLIPADVSFVAVVGRLAELAPAIGAMAAHTDEGMRAKGAAVGFMASAQPETATDDAELIGLCVRHDALLAEAQRLGDADPLPDNADAEIRRLTDEANAIGQTITTMRTTTPAGIVALARTTAAWADGLLVDNDTDPLLKMLFRDSLALDTVPSRAVAAPSLTAGPSIEITAAIAAVMAGRALCEHVDATTPGDDAACDASADVHGRALDACGSVRITTLADASAIAALALRYLAADDIAGQADVVTRGLLRSLAAIPSGGAHPDAALLALHDRFIALEAESRNLQQTFPDDGARAVAQEPITNEQESIVTRTWDLNATTLEGHRARARMLLAWDSELKNGATGGEGVDAEMLWLLVRDLLGEDHADALQSPDLGTYLQGIETGRSGAIPAAPVEPVLSLIADANRLRAEAAAFPWDTNNDAEFQDLCSRTRAAVHSVAAAPTTSPAGLRAVSQFLLEEHLSGGASGGFDHSDAESAALVLLKRLAGDPEPSNPDATARAANWQGHLAAERHDRTVP